MQSESLSWRKPEVLTSVCVFKSWQATLKANWISFLASNNSLSLFTDLGCCTQLINALSSLCILSWDPCSSNRIVELFNYLWWSVQQKGGLYHAEGLLQADSPFWQKGKRDVAGNNSSHSKQFTAANFVTALFDSHDLFCITGQDTSSVLAFSLLEIELRSFECQVAWWQLWEN